MRQKKTGYIINPEIVGREIQKMAICYPKNKTQAELAVITASLCEDLSLREVLTNEFLRAVPAVKLRCRFFPTSADFMEVIYENRLNPKTEVKALPEPVNMLSDKDRAKWVKKFKRAEA